MVLKGVNWVHNTKSSNMLLRAANWVHNDKLRSYGLERGQFGYRMQSQVIWS